MFFRGLNRRAAASRSSPGCQLIANFPRSLAGLLEVLQEGQRLSARAGLLPPAEVVVLRHRHLRVPQQVGHLAGGQPGLIKGSCLEN